MDKIWYRNPSKSEVIGRFGGDEKKRMITQNRQKFKNIYIFFFYYHDYTDILYANINK